MKKLLLLLCIVSAVVFFACSKGNNADSQPPAAVQPGSIQLTGVLQRQGFSTYMYGTHILIITGSTVGYALKSTVLNLDPFINKTVTLTGNRVAGYPVDGGPPYIDVQTIK